MKDVFHTSTKAPYIGFGTKLYIHEFLLTQINQFLEKAITINISVSNYYKCCFK